MNTLLKIIPVMTMTVLFGCAPRTKEDVKSVYVKRIDSLENRLKGSQSIDNMAASDLIGAYSAYAENFPADSITPDYLFKAGEVASSIRQGERAITIFNTIYEQYPAYDKAHYCLFLQGFIYETQVNNLQKAKEFYNMVIEKYPNEPIAGDAKACIANLGKSDEELIKEFEEKNKNGS